MTPTGGIALDPAVVEGLEPTLSRVAESAVEAITAEVAEYADAFRGEMGQNIRLAVQTALGAFLRLAAQSREADPSTPLQPALEGAYALGRGEARSGRSVDALLAAYRVGARVSWRELSAAAVEGGLEAGTVASFAELVFAYIDQLSAASVAGHSDELDTTGRVRQRYLERLGQELLQGAPPERLALSAERADWDPPEQLTAVLLPSARVRGVVASLTPRTLVLSGDLVELDASLTVLLVPTGGAAERRRLVQLLGDRGAVVGPARRWTEVAGSLRRALRARALLLADDDRVLDTDAHLAELTVGADLDALADLRARALAPLAGQRPATAERLTETLRAWLLHHGRREEVAAALVVHPQTVRYRMTQLRELFGERLTDPAAVLELTVALAVEPPAARAAQPPAG